MSHSASFPPSGPPQQGGGQQPPYGQQPAYGHQPAYGQQQQWQGYQPPGMPGAPAPGGGRRKRRAPIVILVLLVLGITAAPGWDRVRDTFLDLEVAREAFPRVLEGLWLNIRLLVFCALGALALGLAAVGLFGVVAHQVTIRRREIGIRMAVGAGGERVVRRFVIQGLRPAILGVGAGLALATFGVRLLQGLLFGVTPGDPWAWGSSVAVLLSVAAAASLWPAYRAVRVDPVEVLRAE